MAILRVVLRGVVEERLWEGKALPYQPTKRRKMVGVWAFGLANRPGATAGQRCHAITDDSSGPRSLSSALINILTQAAVKHTASGAVFTDLFSQPEHLHQPPDDNMCV